MKLNGEVWARERFSAPIPNIMARKITLEKLESIHSDEERAARNVNPKEKGTMFFGPTVGRPFTFYTDDGRYFYTSDVQNIQYIDDKTIGLKTKNSTYRIDIGEEIEPK